MFLNSFLQVVLLTRDDEGKLFGHPVITHLPCEASGSLYYNAVSSLLPEPLAKLQWSLCLTDAKVSIIMSYGYTVVNLYLFLSFSVTLLFSLCL